MNTVPHPKHGDALHDALNFLGLKLIDGTALDKTETGDLGCLLLILADYAYLDYLAAEE